MIYAAVVVEVMPAVPGLRVQFKDLARSGFAQYDFVRVLMPRMSPVGGAAAWLPEVGEMGIVGELEGGYLVWLGSLPFLGENQVDPTPGLAYLKHQSGVVFQVRENGDTELSHPSGLKVTLSRDGSSLPPLKASSNPPSSDAVVPVLTITHPSGAMATIESGGKVVLQSSLIELRGMIKNSGVSNNDASDSASFTTPTGDVVTIQSGVITSVCAPGGTLLNLKYFDNLIASINAVQTCPDLTVVAGDAFSSLGAAKAAMTAQMAKVNTWAALLSAPTSPTAAVTWITNFITSYLTPQALPSVTYPLQLAALTAKVADLTTAINNAKGRIPGCTYTVPVL